MTDDKAINPVINELRRDIDAIDDDILQLLHKRAELARQVGVNKNGAFYRPEREAVVIKRMQKNSPGILPKRSVRAIYREIMSACLNLEQTLNIYYPEHGCADCQMAAWLHFGLGPTYHPCASLEEVVKQVEMQPSSYAVLPLSAETASVLSILQHSELKICGEVGLDARRHYLVLGDYETEPSGDDCTYVLLPDSRLNLTQPEQLPGNGIIREAGLTTSVETGMRLLPLNGHIKQAELQQAITILQNQYQDLRVLGSCPQNLTEF